MSTSLPNTASSCTAGAPIKSNVAPFAPALASKIKGKGIPMVTPAQSKLLLDIFHVIAFALTAMLIQTKTTFDFVVKQLIFLLLLFYFVSRLIENKTMYGIYHCTYALTIVLAPLLLTNKHMLFIHVLVILLAITTRKLYRGCLMRNLDRNNKISSNSLTKKVNWDLLLPSLGAISAFKLYIY